MRIENLKSSGVIGTSAAEQVLDKIVQKEVRKIVNEDDVRVMGGSAGMDQSEGYARTCGEKDVLVLSLAAQCCPETASHAVAMVANHLAVQVNLAHNSAVEGTDMVMAAREAQGPDASMPAGSDWQTGSRMIVRQVRSLQGSHFPRPNTMCRKVELKTLNIDLGVEDVKSVVHVGTTGGVERRVEDLRRAHALEKSSRRRTNVKGSRFGRIATDEGHLVVPQLSLLVLAELLHVVLARKDFRVSHCA